MRTTLLSVMMGIVGFSSCLADEPSAAVEPGASAVITAPVAAKTVTTDAAKEAAEAKRQAAAEKIKKVGFGGYKPETHNGVTVYCRSEAAIGSRFQSKTCRTYDELMESAKNGQEYVDTIRQQGAGVRPSN